VQGYRPPQQQYRGERGENLPVKFKLVINSSVQNFK
jgi:hypothetical protein